MGDVVGLLLAAGAGSRMGMPKALLRDAHGDPQLAHAVHALLGGGCCHVTVVIGAAADQARRLLAVQGLSDRPDVDVVVADGWAEGMGASLRAGLAALPDADAAVVMLVDLPDVGSTVVGRLLSQASTSVLLRASYDGRPGHPVVLGRDHWPDVIRTATGDRGARDYLDAHEVRDVPCADLATGSDTDAPEDLPR